MVSTLCFACPAILEVLTFDRSLTDRPMTLADFISRARYQGGPDRTLGKWRIIDVHQIPEKFDHEHEVDFWCCDGRIVFLLHLRCREREHFTVIRKDYGTWIIAELPIERFSNTFLEEVLTRCDSVLNSPDIHG
jgi:hypothetical protein